MFIAYKLAQWVLLPELWIVAALLGAWALGRSEKRSALARRVLLGAILALVVLVPTAFDRLRSGVSTRSAAASSAARRSARNACGWARAPPVFRRRGTHTEDHGISVAHAQVAGQRVCWPNSDASVTSIWTVGRLLTGVCSWESRAT